MERPNETSEESRYLPTIRDKFDPIESIILKEIDSIDLPDRTHCGIQGSDNRIVGGEQTLYDEFPWVVAIVHKNKQNEETNIKCGDSLINKRFVLTSASCSTYEWKPIEVRLGEWNLTSDPDCSDCDPVQVVKIEKNNCSCKLQLAQ
ncbi:hypothetical protein ILUMI_20758 [Ignelater luminosus]|uniref:Peptidase S1 domain-containing protein n=1 Tax=Ignelater luminosus TaxID=2038154 RepID=A0A8K0CDQ0_IGNLU|nr:hypothetical protein ILUMI_20758 [Ignelater luminosus]